MTIAYQGEFGAHSDAAAHAFDPDAATSGLPTFHAVFEAVASGEAHRGVVPTENSTGGSIRAVLDGLLAFDGLTIVGERWRPIAHALLAPEGMTMEDVREVRSHPQALRQCADALAELLPGAALVEASDTAGAARQIAQDRPEGVAALASAHAAELYGLAVLSENVASETTNVTRFVLVAPAGTDAGTDAETGATMKTTLALTPRETVPNALFRSLTAFVGRRLGVWKVEPSPLLGHPGAYRYLVDIEGDADSEPLSAALDDLPAFNDTVRVLGSYAAAEIPR